LTPGFLYTTRRQHVDVTLRQMHRRQVAVVGRHPIEEAEAQVEARRRARAGVRGAQAHAFGGIERGVVERGHAWLTVGGQGEGVEQRGLRRRTRPRELLRRDAPVPVRVEPSPSAAPSTTRPVHVTGTPSPRTLPARAFGRVYRAMSLRSDASAKCQRKT
jgi:hypothetical protein